MAVAPIDKKIQKILIKDFNESDLAEDVNFKKLTYIGCTSSLYFFKCPSGYFYVFNTEEHDISKYNFKRLESKSNITFNLIPFDINYEIPIDIIYRNLQPVTEERLKRASFIPHNGEEVKLIKKWKHRNYTIATGQLSDGNTIYTITKNGAPVTGFGDRTGDYESNNATAYINQFDEFVIYNGNSIIVISFNKK
jgi:hypothetical protein